LVNKRLTEPWPTSEEKKFMRENLKKLSAGLLTLVVVGSVAGLLTMSQAMT
jgi:hypothetical protein